ncbi:uncharacterized protein LOC118483984 [Helianthus annuus]|uniref:uncharacterized protein LOC118483984 n=1 Tax=Helianthus annuus TaxID=4232 RepID=UPI00165331D8|nr:uncharacterized protein LOC118483984 [Helianthus annuus]
MALVPVKEAGSMPFQVPVLTQTDYPMWEVKVKAIMDANGVWETVEPRALGAEPDEKKAKQALAFLFQTILEEMVLQMGSYTDPKQVWDGLKTRELENMRIKEDEAVDDFVVKLNGIASKPFFQLMASIEQCFDLDTMLFDEAIGRLKGYEERLKAKEKTEDIQDGLLLASHEKPHGCKHCGVGSSNQDDFGCGQGRGRGSVRGRDGNERFRDKSHVKCYKCGEYGHYNNECPKLKNEEANLIEEEPALL